MVKKLFIACVVLSMLVAVSGIAQAGLVTGTITNVNHLGTQIQITLTRADNGAVLTYPIDAALDVSTQREMLAIALTAMSLTSTVTANRTATPTWTTIAIAD